MKKTFFHYFIIIILKFEIIVKIHIHSPIEFLECTRDVIT